jgi:hypothetical protein
MSTIDSGYGRVRLNHRAVSPTHTPQSRWRARGATQALAPRSRRLPRPRSRYLLSAHRVRVGCGVAIALCERALLCDQVTRWK